ncbi:MAG: InlB B-repeat-containing protein, partial [Acutalibacteraceae bacterium]
VAQWEAVPVPQSTITFDTDGGNEIDPITGNVGDPVTAPADPVKDGFNFMGWEPRIPDTFPADDLTVVAQWEEDYIPQSTITFDTDGGNEIDPITGNVGDPVTAPADPVKDGFNFMGWEPQIPDTFPEDDLTVVAQWEEIPAPPQSTITFDTAGGNEIDPITGEVGSPVTAPADPVKDGFNFMGWEPQIPATFPADDLTVVAQWEEKPVLQVKITFLVDGMEYDVLEGDSGTAVTPPANPTKSGYVFAGWSPAVPANFPDEDLTVEAQWILLGDVNNDGVVNSYDALAVLRHSTGEALLDEPYATAGDVNGDGKLSSLDALMILHYVSGKLPEFPAA